MQIKVCGITNPHNLKDLSCLAIDRMGFIFYDKSPRYMKYSLSADSVNQLPQRIKRVGVFVNEDFMEVESMIQKYVLNTVQFHGDETPDYCEKFRNKVEVIKAISIKDEESVKLAKEYENSCDLFLFDTYGKNYGGTGKTFDWRVLERYNLNKNFYMSGGIGLDEIKKIKKSKMENLTGVDVNSKFETSVGIKDINKLKQLIQELNGN